MELMKTLVIIAHPDIDTSRVNKRWKQELLSHPEEITIHELYQEYPNWIIDVPREQKLLEAYQRIVFQFPLYWYSYPPLLKKWFDDVFTHGWAYGSTGNALLGKEFVIAVSIGDKKENYSKNGPISFTVDEILAPLKASANHVGAIVLPYVSVFGASFQASDEEIHLSAQQYLESILKEI